MAHWTADRQGLVVKTTELLTPETYRKDPTEARFEKARQQVDPLTPCLLACAFGGKLVPQDPTDEPASALLRRLRSPRGASARSTSRSPRQSGVMRL